LAGQVSEDYFVRLGDEYTRRWERCNSDFNDPKIINGPELYKKYLSNENNEFDQDENGKFHHLMQCSRFEAISKIYTMYTRKNTMQAFNRYTKFPPGVREYLIQYMGTFDDVIEKFNQSNDKNDMLFFNKQITRKEHREKFENISNETINAVAKEYYEVMSNFQGALNGKPIRSAKNEKIEK